MGTDPSCLRNARLHWTCRIIRSDGGTGETMSPGKKVWKRTEWGGGKKGEEADVHHGGEGKNPLQKDSRERPLSVGFKGEKLSSL